MSIIGIYLLKIIYKIKKSPPPEHGTKTLRGATQIAENICHFTADKEASPRLSPNAQKAEGQTLPTARTDRDLSDDKPVCFFFSHCMHILYTKKRKKASVFCIILIF
jgi:hypothetical protein